MLDEGARAGCLQRISSVTRSTSANALLFFSLIGLLAACAPRLVVHSGAKAQGTLKQVKCQLARPWPAPGRVAIALAVETTCKTKPEVFVHVFRRDIKLSSLRRENPLVTCPEPICEENKFDSASFSYPGEAEVRVEVHALCEGGEPIQGAVACHVP